MMERVNEHECEFRFGDHGPKYLLRGPRLEWGIIRFQPGQELGAHKHEEVEETFYFEEGTPLMVAASYSSSVRTCPAIRSNSNRPDPQLDSSTHSASAAAIRCAA